MNISKQVGNQAHLLVIEQSSKKLSLTYCREKNCSGHFRNDYYDYSAINGQSAKSSNADAVSGISCSRAKFLD